MADLKSPSPTSWVENALASLLSAPHISLTKPPGSIVGGPGPIDLFSTRFENTFTLQAKGAVDGEYVDRAGLKENLLALQHHYNPDTVKFHPHEPVERQQGHSSDEVQVSFTWTSKGEPTEHEVSTDATVVTENGGERISFLTLKGKRNLFQ